MRVVVVQIPPYDPQRPIGGGEVVAAEVVKALAPEAQVNVICGRWPDTPTQQTTCSPVPVVAGFLIDGILRRSGHVRPRLSPQAAGLLRAADVVISVERSLDLELPGKRVVLLVGVGAPHTLDLLRYGRWDLLVVPSESARQMAREAAPDRSQIVVVPNGIDTDLFDTAPRAKTTGLREIKLLVPARPVAAKGLAQALQVAARVRARHGPTTLVLTDLQDDLDQAAFLADMKWGDTVTRVLTWCERERMPSLYRAADVVLCLSQVAEGFGLAAAESLSCGTPVLATSAGHLGQLVPSGHGMAWIDSEREADSWDTAIDYVLGPGSHDVATRGRPWIAEHYGLDRMHVSIRAQISALFGQ